MKYFVSAVSCLLWIWLPGSLQAQEITLSSADSASLLTLRSQARGWYGDNLDSMSHYAGRYRQVATRLNASYFLADAWLLLGTASMEQGDHGKATQEFIRAYQIADSAQMIRPKVMAQINLGAVYHHQKKYQEALSFYKAGIHGYHELNMQSSLGQPLYNLAIVFQDMGQTDSAKHYYLIALPIAGVAGDSLSLADLYNSLGNLVLEQGSRSEAIHYFSKAASIAESLGEDSRHFYPLLNLGTLATAEKRLGAARRYLTTARDLAYSLSSADMQIDIERALASLDSANHQYDSAYQHLARWTTLVQQQQELARQTQLDNLQAQFNSDRQEQMLAAQAAEIAEQDKNLRFQRARAIVLATGLFVLLALSLALRRVSLIRKRQSEALLRMNEDKDTMLQAVAHDLQSPTVNIRGLIDVLQDAQALDAEGNSIVTMIQKELDRSDHLIRSLLELESIEAGDWTVSMLPVNLSNILEEVAEKYRYSAQRKQIWLETAGLGEEVSLTTDPHFIARILDNLLSNAIKFSPAGSRIGLSLQRASDQVRIEVSDQGPGITEEDQMRMFGRFQRLSAKPTGGESSTGLGLAITKAMTDRLRGRIEVHSQPGRGSTFAVVLPQ